MVSFLLYNFVLLPKKSLEEERKGNDNGGMSSVDELQKSVFSIFFHTHTENSLTSQVA